MFTDFQNKLAEQAGSPGSEAWSQFMRMQAPMVGPVVGSYMEQSQSLLATMQEQMQKQAEQMMGMMGIKR